MSKTTILTLAQTLALSMADSTAIDQFYDEILQDLARTVGPLANVSLIQSSAFDPSQENNSYSIPIEGVSILHVWYGEKHLHPESTKAIDSINALHRDKIGEPLVFTIDETSDKTFRVIDAPEISSEPMTFPNGAPLGVDYPPNGLAVAYTETRTDLPRQWNLPIALAILSREFSRESDHRDPAFAKACGDLSIFMLKALTRNAA